MKSCHAVSICACLILSGCLSSTKYITKRGAVLPPEQYLEHCKPEYKERSIEDSITGLSALVDCERADKAAIRRWADEYKQEAED